MEPKFRKGDKVFFKKDTFSTPRETSCKILDIKKDSIYGYLYLLEVNMWVYRKGILGKIRRRIDNYYINLDRELNKFEKIISRIIYYHYCRYIGEKKDYEEFISGALGPYSNNYIYEEVLTKTRPIIDEIPMCGSMGCELREQLLNG